MGRKTKGSGTFVKYLLIIFNTLFVLAGLALLVISVWALADEQSLSIVIKTRVFLTFALALLAISVTIICTAALGCFGAVKELKWVMVLFSGILLFFLVVTLSGVIALYMLRHPAGRAIRASLTFSLKEGYLSDPKDHQSRAIKDSWDWLQQNFRCCGVRGNVSAAYYAWQYSQWFRDPHRDDALVPESCCVPRGPGIVIVEGDSTTFINRDKCLAVNNYTDFRGPPRTQTKSGVWRNDAIFDEGCYDSFRKFIGQEMNLVIIVCIVVAMILLEVIGLGLACHLCRRIKSYSQLELESFTKGKRNY